MTETQVLHCLLGSNKKEDITAYQNEIRSVAREFGWRFVEPFTTFSVADQQLIMTTMRLIFGRLYGWSAYLTKILVFRTCLSTKKNLDYKEKRKSKNQEIKNKRRSSSPVERGSSQKRIREASDIDQESGLSEGALSDIIAKIEDDPLDEMADAGTPDHDVDSVRGSFPEKALSVEDIQNSDIGTTAESKKATAEPASVDQQSETRLPIATGLSTIDASDCITTHGMIEPNEPALKDGKIDSVSVEVPAVPSESSDAIDTNSVFNEPMPVHLPIAIERQANHIHPSTTFQTDSLSGSVESLDNSMLNSVNSMYTCGFEVLSNVLQKHRLQFQMISLSMR